MSNFSAQSVSDSREQWNFAYDVPYAYDAGVGLSEKTLEYIAAAKEEPEWILQFRKNALKIFNQLTIPYHWAPAGIREVDFSRINYYRAQATSAQKNWEQVHHAAKATFERLGIPDKEKQYLAGVEAQFDSESAYSRMKEKLAEQGVLFMGPTEALKHHPDIFLKYFAKIVPPADNKFSALNSSVFSGGSFIYVPPGVKITQPLQAYFRINSEALGQFERTLIIADEGSEVTYLEGCTAPSFDTANLHSAVVELVACRGAKIQYITIQNWSNSVHNLVTKRAWAEEEAQVRWIDCNIGSKLTMKYPGVVLRGKKARGEVLSIALANNGQYQDTGAKMIHLADETTSNIVSKSIGMGNGTASFRGLVDIGRHLKNCKNNTRCDTLLISPHSASATYPTLKINGDKSFIQQEASVSKISAEQLFYMQQRGISENDAMSLSINGFVNELVREFPMEYGVELRRLIDADFAKLAHN